MKGWKIFHHSVRQVFGNFGAALRVSAVPFVVQMAAMFAFTGTAFLASDAEKQRLMEAGEFPWLGLVAFWAVAGLSGLWMAVGWHRFVLANEQPGLLPAFHGDRMWGYFWTGVWLAVLACIPFAGILLVILIGTPSLPSVFTLFTPMVLIVAGVIFVAVIFRLLAVLPGVALREDVPALSGWEATKGQTGATVGLVIVCCIVTMAGDAVADYLLAANGTVGVGSLVLWLWAQTMVGLSILTTLYGHYVEDRPLA